MKRTRNPAGLQGCAGGSVLLLCLIFLLVFSFMSAAGIERATLDARMADNLREYYSVRHAGERLLDDLARDLIIGQASNTEAWEQAGTVMMPPYQATYLVQEVSNSSESGVVVSLQVQLFEGGELSGSTDHEAVFGDGQALIGLVAVLARQCLDDSCSWYRRAWYTADELTGQ